MGFKGKPWFPFMRIAVSTSSKNEKHIIEWIRYYMKIGIDYFVIYDDLSEPSVQTLLESANINSSMYTVFRNTDVNHLYKTIDTAYIVHKCWGSECWQNQIIPCLQNNHIDYMLYVDVDEFLCLDKHKNIHDLVEHYMPVDVLKINWVFFGAKQHILDNTGLDNIIDTFTTSDDSLCEGTGSMKTITKVDKIVLGARQYGPHVFPIHSDAIVKDIFNNILENYGKILDHETPFLGSQHLGNIYIAHYFCQDLTTFIRRKFSNKSNYYWWLNCVGMRDRTQIYAYIDVINDRFCEFVEILDNCISQNIPPCDFDNIPASIIQTILEFYGETNQCCIDNHDIVQYKHNVAPTNIR